MGYPSSHYQPFPSSSSLLITLLVINASLYSRNVSGLGTVKPYRPLTYLTRSSYNSLRNANGLFRAFPAAAFLVGLVEAEVELSLAEVVAALVVVVALDLAATAVNRTAMTANQEICMFNEGWV